MKTECTADTLRFHGSRDRFAGRAVHAAPEPAYRAGIRSAAYRRYVRRARAAVKMALPMNRRGGRNMRFRRWTSALLFVLAGTLLGTASVDSAGPKEDVAAATLK